MENDDGFYIRHIFFHHCSVTKLFIGYAEIMPFFLRNFRVQGIKLDSFCLNFRFMRNEHGNFFFSSWFSFVLSTVLKRFRLRFFWCRFFDAFFKLLNEKFKFGSFFGFRVHVIEEQSQIFRKEFSSCVIRKLLINVLYGIFVRFSDFKSVSISKWVELFHIFHKP